MRIDVGKAGARNATLRCPAGMRQSERPPVANFAPEMPSPEQKWSVIAAIVSSRIGIGSRWRLAPPSLCVPTVSLPTVSVMICEAGAAAYVSLRSMSAQSAAGNRSIQKIARLKRSAYDVDWVRIARHKGNRSSPSTTTHGGTRTRNPCREALLSRCGGVLSLAPGAFARSGTRIFGLPPASPQRHGHWGSRPMGRKPAVARSPSVRGRPLSNP